MNHSQTDMIKVSLFCTCIIDQLYPEVGKSVVNVLRQSGCDVDFPINQTCCGQPLYNSGFTQESKKLALKVLNDFEYSNFRFESMVAMDELDSNGVWETLISVEFPDAPVVTI